MARLPRASSTPEDRALLGDLRAVIGSLRDGVPPCELVDDIERVMAACVSHPDVRVRHDAVVALKRYLHSE